MHALVVGGGIMGLSTAWGLVRMGHQVTVLEQGPIPHPLGSSVDQHRLIRHPYAGEMGYARMVDPAFSAWDQLWGDLGASHFQQTGTLVVASGETRWAEASMETLTRMGMSAEVLTGADIERDYPALTGDGVDLAFRLPTGGALYADRIVAGLAGFLQSRGATVAAHTPVDAIDPDNGAVVLKDGTRLAADVVIVAAGPWVQHLVPPMSARVTPSRQAVIYLEPPPHLARAWAQSPMILDIHQLGGIYVIPPVPGTGLKVGDHSFSLMGDPDADRTAGKEEIEVLRSACCGRFRDLDAYRIDEGRVCFYTVEPQEHFIAEPIGRTWVLAGFSGHGFKFGALMGRVMARAVTGHLDPQTMARFAAGQITDPETLADVTGPALG